MYGMYVCMYVCMYIYIYVYIYMYTYMYVFQTFKVVDLLKPKFVSRLDVWFLTDDHRMTHCLLPDCMAFDTTS